MSSTHEGSSSQHVKTKKSDKGRRIWTLNEEGILIASLKELIAQGWKSDNGFRACYLNKLEEALKYHFPTTDLRASPHINSKLSTWKKNYYSLFNILNRSGVGFNVRGNHKIDCEDATWEQVVKADPNARQMRFKSWPYFYEWKEIFGKDRVNGEGVEDADEAFHEFRTHTNDMTNHVSTGIPYEVNLDDLEPEGAAESNFNTPKSDHVPPIKTLKNKTTTKSISGVCDILVEIGRKADARLASLAESLGYEAQLGKTLEDVFEQLGSISHLSMEERFEVCAILGAQVDKLKIFKGMPTDARAQFVDWLLIKFK